jgi:predicted ATPase
MQRLSEEHKLPAAMAKAKIFAGWALAHSCNLDRGLQLLNEGLALQKQTGTEEDSPVYDDIQAELLSMMGKNAEAIGILDRTILKAETSGHTFWLAELYRRRAMILHKLDRARNASESDLRHALAVATDQGARELLSRAEADFSPFCCF